MINDANPVPRTAAGLLAGAIGLFLIGLPMPVVVHFYRSYNEYYYLYEGNNVYVLAIDAAVMVGLLITTVTRRGAPGWLLWPFVALTALMTLVAVVDTTNSQDAYTLGLLVLTVQCALRIAAVVRLIRHRRRSRLTQRVDNHRDDRSAPDLQAGGGALS